MSVARLSEIEREPSENFPPKGASDCPTSPYPTNRPSGKRYHQTDSRSARHIAGVKRLSLTFGDRGSSRVMNRRPGAVCISLATVWEQLRPHFEAAATAFRALLPRVGARSAFDIERSHRRSG